MSRLWTEKLARDCALVGRTVIAVAAFLRFVVKWVTPDQGAALLWIGMGIMICAQVVQWQARKSANALLHPRAAADDSLT
jgi:hypothetical protein